MTYDNWKTTDPSDKEFCRCGIYRGDCLMDDCGRCPHRSDYDAGKDLAGSIREGFAAIRERIANGGPGWKPKK